MIGARGRLKAPLPAHDQRIQDHQEAKRLMQPRRRRATKALALVLAFLAFARGEPASAEQAAQPFTLDDAIGLVRIASPRISPDGERVLYSRAELNWEENEYASRIWIVGADGGDARVFTGSEDDSNADWSPDGRWVSFTRPVGEGSARKRQIFLLRSDGGEAVQLTRHAVSVGAYEWGDDRSIFFLADDSLPQDRRKEHEKGDDAIFIDEGPNGQTRGRWNGLWRVELVGPGDTAKAERITKAGIRIGDFAVSPDGNHVAYAFRGEGRRNAGNLSEVSLIGVRTREESRITSNDAPESQLAWSPDGRMISFVAPDLETWELDQGNLYVHDIPTGNTRQLLQDFQPDIRGYEWSPGGREIHFVALDRTDAQLWAVDARSDEARRLTDEAGVLGAISFDAGHRRAAATRASPASPGDLWLYDLVQGTRTQLINSNPQLAEKSLREPEIVRWRSSDGLEIEGLLYRAGEGPAPLVLNIHGGPAGVFTRGFSAGAQILLAEGYSVLQPNVRGSTGYGDALLRGNMNDIGGGDYEDLMSGVDEMIRQGIAHPDSLAVKGWSYGGILGGWAITRTDRFRAASLGAMVADWRSEFGAGFNFDVTRWYLGGDPWSNREQWTERSAYTHLDRVETPTILFHGANDRTDTMEQSMNFFAGLRHLGVEARFILFPREGHGIREPRHRRTMMIEEIRWLQRHVRGVEWAAPPRPGETKTPVS